MKKLLIVLLLVGVGAGAYKHWSRGSSVPGTTGGNIVAAQVVTGVLSAGQNHIEAINADGRLYGWGSNEDKELGFPGITALPIPKPLATDLTWRTVHASQRASYAITPQGELWRRTYDRHPITGRTGSEIARSRARKRAQDFRYEPLGWENKWAKAMESWMVAAGLDADGKLWTWYDPDIWLEADRDVGGKVNDPLPVSPERKWLDFCVAKFKVYAVADDGSLWKYDREQTPGERAADTGEPYRWRPTAPILVNNRSQFRRVFCIDNASHVLAIDAANRLWGFGSNEFGELGDGDGDRSTKSLPVPEVAMKQLNDKKWIDVALRSGFTLGIARDGSLWAWGNNAYANLGTGDQQYHDVPRLVDKNNRWVAVTAGNAFGAGLTREGEIYTWGTGGSALGHGGASAVQAAPAKVYGSERWGTTTKGEKHANF